ncbi:hypothetical protein F7725_000534 [Dissostichus mawsoni]|uniref:Tetratricopeptide repeat domain 34 n=1 Tax=Dissostichus mawsoni TaxID=36200 RepID=A0A7J5ZH25_DISMA|nr:hypothetical protein F7725_000534 [Dissostichus mawsoni]
MFSVLHFCLLCASGLLLVSSPWLRCWWSCSPVLMGQILAADALYQLGRVEEAYRLLLSIGPTNPRAPILARLALLQLHRGFLYDTNQLLKKLIQCGDTSCLRPLLAVAQQKDRALLQAHCHSVAKRILEGTKEESA